METTKITIATGNTYAAKSFLKSAGFEWAGGQWIFKGEFDSSIWSSKYANPTYNGRGNAKVCQAVNFEVKTIVA